VTDIEFGVDGAMYFITGGRGTQSALYRVKHNGSEIQPSPRTAQERVNEEYANQSRAARRHLESFLERPDEAHKAEIWPYLGSDDPWVRHAARAALEKLPPETWRKQALEEPDLDRALAARIALTRRGEQVQWIGGELQRANQRQSFELLYLVQRILEEPATDPQRRNVVLKELRSGYPTADASVNQALSNILSAHTTEAFVAKTLALLDSARTKAEQLHYCFVLRNVTTGWTAATRKAYFEHLRATDDFIGGEGLPTFRRLIRQEALASLPADERPQFEQMLATTATPWTSDLPPARVDTVRKWAVNELADAWARSKTERNPIRGKAVFAAARCIVCHRAGGPGGVSGPDLSSVARRFSPRDILASMIEPSKAIDEKYAAVVLELTDGRVVTGRIAPGDYRSPELHVIANLLEPEKTTKVAKADIVHRDTSSVSPMPSGLLDFFQEEEILDLLAFLLSAGRTQQ
jgi:putative heme-binding domain-containing protein